MKHVISIISLILLFVFLGCSKDDNTPAVICNNPDAINYQKNGVCTFLSDSMTGRYGVVISKYDPWCSTNDSGTYNILVVNKGPCITLLSDSSYNVLSFYWINPVFSPSGFCVKLTDGYNFSITEDDNIYWYGAPVKGTGSFANNKFTFSGTVQVSCGDFPLILNGER